MSLITNHSYGLECKMLLEDASYVKEVTVEEKIKLIESGLHYSDIISKESYVDQGLIDIFKSLTIKNKEAIGKYISIVCQQLYCKFGTDFVIASLHRAGTPYGVCVRRYFQKFYGVDLNHYSISIIKGRSLDVVAMDTIINENPNKPIVFLDGWTSIGRIKRELDKELVRMKEQGMNIPKTCFAVILDSSLLADVVGVYGDELLPNAILNSDVSGKVSRSMINRVKNECHRGKILEVFEDVSMFYVDELSSCLVNTLLESPKLIECDYKTIVDRIKQSYDNCEIRLGIGESSRALTRHKTSKILVPDLSVLQEIPHIQSMAETSDIPIVEVHELLGPYKVCAMIEKSVGGFE